MSDLLIHTVLATFLQNLPSYLLSLLISYAILKQVFKGREVKPLTQKIIILIGSLAVFAAFLSVQV